jgi:uncharacterized iron-regulated protein
LVTKNETEKETYEIKEKYKKYRKNKGKKRKRNLLSYAKRQKVPIKF